MAAEEETPPGNTGKADDGARRAASSLTLDLEARVAKSEPGEPSRREDVAGSTVKPDEIPRSVPAIGQNATETDSSSPADEQAAHEAEPGESTAPRPGVFASGLAGVLGGLIVLILGYGLQMAGVVPTPGRSDAMQAIADASALKDTVSTLDQRVTSIESANAQSIADRALLDDLARHVGAVDAFGTSLSDRLLTVEASIAALSDQTGSAGDADAGTKQSLESLAARLGRLENAPPATASEESMAALAKIDQRISAIETELARLDALAKAPPPITKTDVAARTIAIGSLRRAAAQSGPFAEGLALIDRLGVAPAAVASLKPLAETGAPSRVEISAEFPKVADAILAAARPSGDDSGLVERLVSYGRDLVKIRPKGPISGTDPAAIVSRMRTATDAGDLAKALAERQALPTDGQAASQAWADAVANRLEIDRLVDEIAAAPGAGSGQVMSQ